MTLAEQYRQRALDLLSDEFDSSDTIWAAQVYATLALAEERATANRLTFLKHSVSMTPVERAELTRLVRVGVI